MASKKSSKKSGSSDKKKKEKKKSKKKKTKKPDLPTLKIEKERDIAMDFALKVYKKFDKMTKSVVLFGSTAKRERVAGSDIDIIIVVDDVSIDWDQELIAWYREELNKIIENNPYKKSLHINTIKLSTWWEDILRGDPIVLNILRYGQAMVDVAGFFRPLKAMLLKGKIKASPEAIYTCLQRAPSHIARSKSSELGAIEGLFWSMVDASHAALISAKYFPASPEHIPFNLKLAFVNEGHLKEKYVEWYKDLMDLHKKISHGEITDLQGVEIDKWQERADEFLNVMAKLVKKTVG
ncbi:MAG TPA: nucleotidyltransferase domain-containing protein [Candidatus Nanoarchaeia archaeon]|nr:nucleotidyltransferase domain-containing protein [Candidatus Nanoarchaeia archaeon]